MSLKHNFQYENILNELSDEYCFKNISLSNTSEIINDLYSKSKIINENVFKFVMHEVIDNIFEHSQFTQAFALAKSCVNIADYCFLDNGISIQNSFENKNFNFKNDSDAILKAINGKSIKQVSGYIERGYGLNNIVSLLTLNNNGSVLIASRRGIVYIDNKKVYLKELLKKSIEGTIICLRFEINQDFNNFYSLIDGFHNFEVDYDKN